LYTSTIGGGNVKVIDEERMKYKDFEWLDRKHNIENKSLREICRTIGVSRNVVSRWMDELGVKKRTKEEGASKVQKRVGYKQGKNHHRWKGGRPRNHHGYVMIKNDGKMRLEHRVIMENHIGRKLKENEHIHHKNGVRDDNRIENLQIVDPVEHQRIHNKLEIPEDELTYLVEKGYKVSELCKYYKCTRPPIMKRIKNLNLRHHVEKKEEIIVHYFKRCIKCKNPFTDVSKTVLENKSYCSIACKYNKYS
jgi:hypothetical protein